MTHLTEREEVEMTVELRRPFVAHCGGEDRGDERVDAGALSRSGLLQFGVEFARKTDQALLGLGHIAHDITDDDMLCDIKKTRPTVSYHPAALVKGVDPVTSSAEPTVERLAARARKKQDQADRAFRRHFDGEVPSPSAASRLQVQADEAWRQLTSHREYDARKHGDR